MANVLRMLGPILVLTCSLLTLFSAPGLRAQIPQQMSYQGALYDADGQPLPDGAYDLTFAIYDAIDATTPVWNEQHAAQLVGGVFTVYLGSFEPLTLDFDRSFWVGITRAGENEMTPRLPLLTVPYAFYSANAGIAQSAITATTAESATTADSATTAETANSAKTADRADVAGTLEGGVVQSINKLQGAVTIVGKGPTTVTTDGNEITISSVDGETVSPVLYAPDGTQADLTDGTVMLFDVGYGEIEGATRGARILSLAKGDSANATALTLVAQGGDSARSLALDATGDVNATGRYEIGGLNALRYKHEGDSVSIAIGPGALSFERQRRGNSVKNNIAIGYKALDSVYSHGNVAIGTFAGKALIGSPTQDGNVLIGYRAVGSNLRSDTQGALPFLLTNSVAVGFRAGDSLIESDNLTLVGARAGYSLDSSSTVIAIGRNAANHSRLNGTIAIGFQAAQNIRSSQSVYIGDYAGSDYARNPNATGSTVAIGYGAGQSAFADTSVSYNNVYVGYKARGRNNVAGIGNTVIGAEAEVVGDRIVESVAIGYRAAVTQSYSISLGAARFGLGNNSKVGIATTAPTRFLDVNGDARIGRLGTTITNIIKRTVSHTVPLIKTGDMYLMTVSFEGARPASTVTVSPEEALDRGVLIQYARVSAEDEIEVAFFNASGADVTPGNMDFYVVSIE